MDGIFFEQEEMLVATAVRKYASFQFVETLKRNQRKQFQFICKPFNFVIIDNICYTNVEQRIEIPFYKLSFLGDDFTIECSYNHGPEFGIKEVSMVYRGLGGPVVRSLITAAKGPGSSPLSSADSQRFFSDIYVHYGWFIGMELSSTRRPGFHSHSSRRIKSCTSSQDVICSN